MAKTYCSFLGANTPSGFVSLFDELYNPYESCRVFIVKGGPGTGKSTLMKKAGSYFHKKGEDVEYVYCSSDPHSLDALIVPERRLCIVDGTAPHVVEPRFPGAVENIVNTGDFWRSEVLAGKQQEIRSLTLENSIYHRRSAAYLSAAGSINAESLRLTEKFIDKDKINGFALRFAQRELPVRKTGQPGRRSKRFISAVTPEGRVFLDEAVTSRATRIIAVDDEYTLASSLLVDRIGEEAIRRGYDVIFCHCPMKAKMQCEHIIIPEIRLALVTVKTAHKTDISFDRVIHVRRFLHDGISDYGCSLRFNRRLINELTAQAVEYLQKAKATHDRLEKLYAGAMDFASLDIYCENLIKSIT